MNENVESPKPTGDVEGRCLCGKKFVAGFDEDGGFVDHELPVCPTFEELEPDQFLTWVRLGTN